MMVIWLNNSYFLSSAGENNWFSFKRIFLSRTFLYEIKKFSFSPDEPNALYIVQQNMGCEISQTENPPIGNSAFNISACDPFLNARLQGGYILTKVKPRHRHVMVRMHVHDDFSVFCFFLISFFPPCQTNSRTAHNETDVTKRAKRAPNPGNCSDAILCLSIGLRAGSRRICNWLPSTLAELRLSATDGLKTAVTVVVVVGGRHTPWFDALSLGSNLLSPPQPSRWRRSPRFLDGAGTAIRHRKKRRSCIFFSSPPPPPSRLQSRLCWYKGQTESGGSAMLVSDRMWGVESPV